MPPALTTALGREASVVAPNDRLSEHVPTAPRRSFCFSFESQSITHSRLKTSSAKSHQLRIPTQNPTRSSTCPEALYGYTVCVTRNPTDAPAPCSRSIPIPRPSTRPTPLIQRRRLKSRPISPSSTTPSARRSNSARSHRRKPLPVHC